MIALLRDKGLLSEERIEMLLSWRHSGFSVHNTVRVAAGDTAGIERLGRYLLRSPVAVERLQRDPDTGEVLYQPIATAWARDGPGRAVRARRVPRTTAPARPRAPAAPASLHRQILERRQGAAGPERVADAHCASCSRAGAGHPRTAASPKGLGPPDPPRLRDRPVDLSGVRGRDAHPRLHPSAGRDRPDSRSPNLPGKARASRPTRSGRRASSRRLMSRDSYDPKP